jgi:U4/U6 small nuclear ribonucleoprotein PRP4
MVNQPESFYTEASKSLLDARIDITTYSLAKAAVRIQCARRRRIDEDVDHSDKDWTNFNLELSEIGDDRPFTGCSFSENGWRLVL